MIKADTKEMSFLKWTSTTVAICLRGRSRGTEPKIRACRMKFDVPIIQMVVTIGIKVFLLYWIHTLHFAFLVFKVIKQRGAWWPPHWINALFASQYLFMYWSFTLCDSPMTYDVSANKKTAVNRTYDVIPSVLESYWGTLRDKNRWSCKHIDFLETINIILCAFLLTGST